MFKPAVGSGRFAGCTYEIETRRVQMTRRTLVLAARVCSMKTPTFRPETPPTTGETRPLLHPFVPVIAPFLTALVSARERVPNGLEQDGRLTRAALPLPPPHLTNGNNRSAGLASSDGAGVAAGCARAKHSSGLRFPPPAFHAGVLGGVAAVLEADGYHAGQVGSGTSIRFNKGRSAVVGPVGHRLSVPCFCGYRD